MTEHRYVPGNVDYYNCGRANCEAAMLKHPSGVICHVSASGEIWQPSKRDIVMGGQCVDPRGVLTTFADRRSRYCSPRGPGRCEETGATT